MQIELFSEITPALAEKIAKLESVIFPSPFTTEKILDRLTREPKPVILLAHDEGKPIGFKCGYALNHTTFYSWIGGVVPEARERGAAKKLMAAQHEECVATEPNNDGHLRIILEKNI